MLESKHLTKENNYHELKIVTDGFEKVVSMTATKPELKIECVSKVCFGSIECGQIIRKEIEFMNRSKGKVNLVFELLEKLGVKIVP